MKRPSVVDKEINMISLVNGDVIRKYVDLQWLQKISAKDFKKWQEARRYYYELAGHNEAKIQELLTKDIEDNEKLYIAFLQFDQQKDKSINDHIDEIHGILKDNGLPKYKGKDVCLGGDLVSIPSVSGAILRHDKYESLTATTFQTKYGKVRGLNNRYYPKPELTSDYSVKYLFK